ncbi:protein yippee-like [Dorcoceras hygrometricum]|uniref:Protein yippee-like n=1 Tax=Dorcoceras hygrometricum TaxID=472368 RepID=A0A2Z7AQU3_9LAMI|nr:protein yippee-like [Dorcoceras hygrometricum]
MMTTGMHIAADIYCVLCGSLVGWNYETAQEKSQKYKEGKSVLERCLVSMEQVQDLWPRWKQEEDDDKENKDEDEEDEDEEEEEEEEEHEEEEEEEEEEEDFENCLIWTERDRAEHIRTNRFQEQIRLDVQE